MFYIVSAAIAALTSLIVMAITQLITVRKDEINFRRAKAEELAKRMFEQINLLYQVLDNESALFTRDTELARSIRSQAQALPRELGSTELLLRMYFPALRQFWEPHAKACLDLAAVVHRNVGSGDVTFWDDFKKHTKTIISTHDALVKAIIEFHPELSRPWPHFIVCTDTCCR